MNLPTSLMNSMNDLPGFNQEAFQRVHDSGEQVTSIRFNPAKLRIGNFPISQFQNSAIPWSSYGYYLSERPVFTLDPLFHAGMYYVQEASSMFLEEVLKQTVDLSQPIKVLDLCAAPGGKSTLIQSLISDESLLVSNEVIKTRVNILQENMTKWGAANVVVTNNDAKDFSALKDYFDVMVIDAPCSGSGLFRKDREAIEEWSPENVELCSQRQRRIISDAYPCLKEDGILIYSTCSYSQKEDEDILDWLSKSNNVETIRLKLESNWNIVESMARESGFYGYRFYPDKLKGEGFFIAVIRKREGAEGNTRPVRSGINSLSKNEVAIVKNWINAEANLSYIKHGEDVIGFSTSMESEMPILQKHLYLKQAGFTMGKLTSKELIPEHSLAMSECTSASIASVSLNKEAALQYLRKADVLIDVGQKGWMLVKYNGINLGWIKHLGNRINNYYPKDWRILMR